MGNQLTHTNYKKYGWKPDIPDQRDYYHSTNVECTQDEVDLRDKCPPVYNQGNLGSCTANAIAAAYEYQEIQEDEEEPFVPSRLFIYYNERDMEGTTQSDAGAAIRDGIKSIASVGVVPECDWPYDISKFTERPDDFCYKLCDFHRSVLYKRVQQDVDSLKACLSSGLPIVFGFAVYESFNTIGEDGVMPIPKDDEKMEGGHAVMAVGYTDDNLFIVRNSWGDKWGDEGYFYMPMEYITDSKYCSDFWTVEKVRDEVESD